MSDSPGATGAGRAALVLGREPHPSSAGVATALAFAFLAADVWSPSGLSTAGTAVLGVRRRWLGPLIRDVLEAYRQPPHDASLELSRVIGATESFRAAVRLADSRGAPLRVLHHKVAESRAREMPGLVPHIDTPADLARLLELSVGDLDWFADAKQWNRRSAVAALHHYRYEWRLRPGRTPRLLEIPETRVRAAQKRLLVEVLGLIPTHDAAHGFVPGRSAVTGASRHTGSDVVVSLDLTTFFARVTGAAVYGTLRRAGLPEAVAYAITGLCTTAAPPRVLSAMPPGGDPDERFALRKALASTHLPQGAPSSPMLANLAIRRLDARLQGWAAAAGGTYTRYADDLAFSGGGQLARRPDAFVRGVQHIVIAEGHTANPRKTRVRRASVKQTVTGVVVNARTNMSRRDVDRLKAIIHNCVLHGPESQNTAAHADFRAHLLGRLSWLESLNPERARTLRTEFRRIEW
ncbi:reverse transcriptase family protein [Cryobacterium sp. MLB-32]|uniref:reverse transcriptase family protein n=1 Tax=Cryobacterium sp. MLB-32 TaxID=1529318 RepID=UPI000ACC925D|nr:reverse transcriptase family protein [Cryobacterium sp. MLB-32]